MAEEIDMQKYASIVFLLIVGMMLPACTLTRADTSLVVGVGPQAWFDAPLPESTYPLGAVQIIAHGSDTGGITHFELTANGSALTIPSPDTSSSLVSLTYSWLPPQPGIYQLQLRSQNGSGDWSPYAETVVNIAQQATVTAAAVQSTAGIERTRVSTDTVYYGLSGVVSVPCGDKSVTIQVRAVDPAGITAVTLFYRLQSQGGGGRSAFTGMAMSPAGQDLYQAVLTPQDLFSDALINSMGTSWLQYQAVIQNKAGDTSVRTQVFSDLALKTCTK
jgi:hypothetical protein